MSLQKIEERVKPIWSHRATGHALLWATYISCGVLWFWPQPVGYAVTVLGAAVGIMAFREMSNTQKVLLTLAVFILMFIELNDIRQDKIEREQQVKNDRINEDDRFGHILSQNQEEFSATIEKLNALVDASKSLGVIAKQSLGKLNEREGALVPDRLPSPKVGKCRDVVGSLALYYASGVSYVSKFPHPIVRVNGETLLLIDRDAATGELFITGTIFDDRGDMVAKIERNKFLATYAASYTVKTKNQVVVYNRRGDRVLDINYLNPLAIKIAADVYARDGTEVYFDEHTVGRNRQSSAQYSGNCSYGIPAEISLTIPISPLPNPPLLPHLLKH